MCAECLDPYSEPGLPQQAADHQHSCGDGWSLGSRCFCQTVFFPHSSKVQAPALPTACLLEEECSILVIQITVFHFTVGRPG